MVKPKIFVRVNTVNFKSELELFKFYLRYGTESMIAKSQCIVTGFQGEEVVMSPSIIQITPL